MGTRVFDFRGSNGHTAELFVDVGTTHAPCPVCGAVAEKQLSMPRIALDGCSGDFPTAADAWEKRRESHMRKERENQEKHGTYK